MRKWLILFVFIFALFSCSLKIRAEVCDKIVAIVNGEIITLYELNKRVAEYTGKDPMLLKKYDEEKYRQICRKVLEMLIENKLAESKAKELGLKVSESDVDSEIRRIEREQGVTHKEFLKMLKEHGISYQEYRKQIKREIERMQIVEFEVKSRIVIPEEKIKEYYEKHKDQFATEEKVRISAIFLKAKDPNDPDEMRRLMRRAEVIMERLKAGQDFSELAEEFSEGPGAEEGGDLGYFKVSELDPELRKIIENMKVGDVSGPIIRPFGIQIIKLIDKKKAGVKPLEEVRDYIYRILYNKEVEKRYSSWLNELRKKAYIKIMF